MFNCCPVARFSPLRVAVICLAIFTTPLFGKLPSIHRDGSIFLLHTSVDEDISDVTLCSVESAARTNPSLDVIIYSNSWNESLFDELPANVHVTPLNVLEILEEYPEYTQWYKSRVWMSGFAINNLANALRLVILHAKGGYYIDTDILVLRSLLDIPSNSLGVELVINGSVVINSAIMANFDKASAYLQTVLPIFLKDFQPTIWGHNGPQLLSRTINMDSAVNVISNEAFYPVHWSMIHVLFEPASKHEKLFNILSKSSFVVHLWHSLVASQLKYLQRHSVLETLMQTVCPIAHAQLESLREPAQTEASQRPGSTSFHIRVTSPQIGSLHETFPRVNGTFVFKSGNERDDFLVSKNRGSVDVCFTITPQKDGTAVDVCQNMNNIPQPNPYAFSLDIQNIAADTSVQYVIIIWAVNLDKRTKTAKTTATFNVRFREAKEAQQAKQLNRLLPFLMHNVTRQKISNVRGKYDFQVVVLSQKYQEGENVDMPTYNFIHRGLLPALRNHPHSDDGDRLRTWIWGPGRNAWNENKTVLQNLRYRFGDIEHLDMVLYLPPPWPDDYAEHDTSYAIPPSQLREVSQHVPIGFRQAELVPNYAITDKRLNLINATFLFTTYSNQIQAFIKMQTSWLQNSVILRRIVHAPHAASEATFSCQGFVEDTARDIDILLTGAMDPVVYPLRTRLLHLAAKNQLPGRVVVFPHPGYMIKTLDAANKQLLNYAAHLKRAKINLVTASVRDIDLAKYVESQLSGALIVGSVPESRKSYYSQFMVPLAMSDSDEQIVTVLTKWLDNRDARLKLTAVSYALGLRHTWAGWIQDMVHSLRASRSLHSTHSGYVVLSRLGDGTTSPPIRRSVSTNVLVDGADNALSMHTRQPLLMPTHVEVRIENCEDEDRTLGLFQKSSHRFNRQATRSGSLSGDLHVFVCHQFPWQMIGIEFYDKEDTSLTINTFPGAFQAFQKLRSLDETCESNEHTISLIVLVTSASPLRTWVYSENNVDKLLWNDIVRYLGSQTTLLKRHLQFPDCHKCYQLVNMTISYNAGGNGFRTKEIDLSMTFADHLYAHWGRVLDTAWKMKGVHPDTLLPSVENVQTWLITHKKCRLIDCMDIAGVQLLRDMLFEVYFRGDFTLAWPRGIGIDTEISDYSHFNHTHYNAYAQFFYALAHGGNRCLGELFGA